MEKVVLVDKKDKKIGEEEKFQAHIKGRLHRAFSILVFNSKGELMLQKRSEYKPIAPYLWSNTCCSHPLTNNIEKEAEKRLKQEMGFTCSLKEAFSFYYKMRYGYFFEHEIDHVLLGKYDKSPKINKKEAEDWKWISLERLEDDIKLNPEKYTYWLKKIIKCLKR